MAGQSVYSDMTNIALTKLCLAADYYAEVSPSLARFYTDKVDKMKEEFGLPPSAQHLYCQFCCTVFRPSNNRVRLKAQMKRTRKVRQLQRRSETPGHELGPFQKQLLHLYNNKKNRLTIFCEECKKRTTIWYVGEREKVKEETDECTPDSGTTKLSREARKKLKKKLKRKKQKQAERATTLLDTAPCNKSLLDTAPCNKSLLSSSVLTHRIHRIAEDRDKSTLPLCFTKAYSCSTARHKPKTTATTPPGGSWLTQLDSRTVRNKKKRNKQSYNPLKEMFEKQKTDENRNSGNGIMDLLRKIDQ